MTFQNTYYREHYFSDTCQGVESFQVLKIILKLILKYKIEFKSS